MSIERWKVEYAEREIIKWLNRGDDVFIIKGVLKDKIISYSVNEIYGESKILFTTKNRRFNLKIYLEMFNVDYTNLYYKNCNLIIDINREDYSRPVGSAHEPVTHIGFMDFTKCFREEEK